MTDYCDIGDLEDVLREIVEDTDLEDLAENIFKIFIGAKTVEKMRKNFLLINLCLMRCTP